VIWNEGIGKVAEQYVRKGSKIYIEGQLQTREFTDKDGHQRKVTEVVLQRFRGELVLLGEKGERREDDAPPPRQSQAPARGHAPAADISDEVPF
jgi:single-strand DNA-binding protein